MKYLKIIIIILISIIMSFNTSYATNSGATTWRELQDVDFYGDMSVANELYTIIIINVQQNESIENMSDADLKAYNKIVSKYIDAIQNNGWSLIDELETVKVIQNQVKNQIESMKNNQNSSDETKEEINKTEEKNENQGIAQGKEDSMTGVLAKPGSLSAKHTPDEIIKEGNLFIQSGTEETIKQDKVQQASTTLYNVLLSIGMFATIAIGVYLGIKFMSSSADDKAKVKEALIPYIVGCIVIFGAFGIWKLLITLLQPIELIGR